LYRFKGKKRIWVRQFDVARSNLNHGDAFLLDTGGKRLFVWNGIDANYREKNKAKYFARIFSEEQHPSAASASSGIVLLEDGKEHKEPFSDEFWEALGGKGPITATAEAESDQHAENYARLTIKLFRYVIWNVIVSESKLGR
jgi:hypothetical protein